MRIFTLDGFCRKIISQNKLKGKLLGIDFGTKRIGLAISDVNMKVSYPLTSYGRKIAENDDKFVPQTLQDFQMLLEQDSLSSKRSNQVMNPYKYRMSTSSISHASQYFSKIIIEHDITGIIVGYPLLDNGSPSKLCHEIIDFISKLDVNDVHLRDPAMVPVCTMWNENGTTVAAREYIKSNSTKVGVVQKYKDSVAAGVILQSYLNYMNRQRGI